MLTERKRASIAGVPTAFLDAGRGEAVVALHGVPTSAALFEPLLPHLAGYRVIAPDLLGQGETGTPTRGRLDYAAYEAHLEAFLGAVAPPHFHLIVHDFGGLLGLVWAAKHPGRIRSIVVLSTTVTRSLRITGLSAANLLFGKSFVRRVLPLTLKRGRPIVPLPADVWAAPWTRRRILRSRDLFSEPHLERLRSGLGRIDAPVMLIWGEDDDVFPLSSTSRLVDHLPQATLVTIPRCGHWPTIDAPEEVAEHVRVFLKANAERWPVKTSP